MNKLFYTFFNNKTFRSSLLYIFSSFINSLIPFLLLPLLTNYLTPEDYGRVSIFQVVVGIIYPIISMSFNGSIERMFLEKDNFSLKRYIGTSVIIVFFTSSIFFFFFLMFSNFLILFTNLNLQLLLLTIVVGFSNYLSSLVLTLWRMKEKSIPFTIFQLLNSILSALLSVFLIVFFALTWKGRIFAILFTSLFFAMVSILILIKNKWIHFKFDLEYSKKLLFYGIPIIPHALSGVFISVIDKFIISNLLGLYETGLYSIGQQFGIIINILTSSINLAFVPWLYLNLSKNNFFVKIKIVKITYLYFIALTIIPFLLSFLSRIILNLYLNESYFTSHIYIFWIGLGYTFQGMYFMVVNYIFYVQKTIYLSIVTFTTFLLHGILVYYFTLEFGAIGAAYSTAIIFFIKFILTWILSSKVYKMPWNPLKLIYSKDSK